MILDKQCGSLCIMLIGDFLIIVSISISHFFFFILNVEFIDSFALKVPFLQLSCGERDFVNR